jgi:hypothetical protein
MFLQAVGLELVFRFCLQLDLLEQTEGALLFGVGDGSVWSATIRARDT